VGRVHHHEVGLGHVGNAAALGHLTLLGAQLALDLRVALGVLVLALDFVVRHLQLVHEEVLLQRDVDHRRSEHRQQQQGQALDDPVDQVHHGRCGRLHQQRSDFLKTVRQVMPAGPSHDGRQQHQLEDVDGLLFGEQVADA
jgi:hypothetical protein